MDGLGPVGRGPPPMDSPDPPGRELLNPPLLPELKLPLPLLLEEEENPLELLELLDLNPPPPLEPPPPRLAITLPP